MIKKSGRPAVSLATVLGVACVAASICRADTGCAYQLDPSTAKVEWTGFKTTKKVRVNGTFDRVTFRGVKETEDVVVAKFKSVGAMLSGVRVEIDGVSVNSGNPARDQRLSQFFFGNMAGKGAIKAALSGVHGKDSGTAELKLEMNKRKKSVHVAYKLTEKAGGGAELEITGALDVLDFGAGESVAALGEACLDLHKGEDGISKTWSEAEIRLTASVKKECER